MQHHPVAMIQLAGTLILLGLGMAIEPIPVIGFILTLSTPRGRANGLGFIVGWITTMVVIAVGVVAWNGGDGFTEGSVPADLSYSIQLTAGLALLTVWRLRQRRPMPEGPPTQPGWTRRIDKLNPLGAALLGFLLQPWPLTAAGMAAILRADVGLAQSIVAATIFIAVAASSLIAMLLFQVLAPARASARLGAVRSWLESHRRTAITVLSGALGAWLTVTGLLGLLH